MGYETGFPNKNIFGKTFTGKFLLDLSNYKMMNIFWTYDQEFKTVKTFFRDNKNFILMKIFWRDFWLAFTATDVMGVDDLLFSLNSIYLKLIS